MASKTKTKIGIIGAGAWGTALSNILAKNQNVVLWAKEKNVCVVCSGQEAKSVRKILGPNLPIFTPGVRMETDDKNDQKRTVTPLESIKSGADKVIMGRGLIKGNIEENINQVLNSLEE